MWVKICANTNTEDALLAAEYGAHAVGFVFAPSTRRVTVEQVAAITPALPRSLEKIGVFYSTDFDEIAGMVHAAGLTGAQLHEAYEPHLVERLRERGITVLQTIHWQTGIPAEEQVRSFSQTVSAIDAQGLANAVLVDSRTPTAKGGTGVSFDWSEAARVLRCLKTPVVVAGGLHPGNVAEAIGALQPWGVDVATGVESMPGKKDRAKLRAFIENAKAANSLPVGG